MDFKLAFLIVASGLVLSACGGGMQVGGPPAPDATTETLSEDNPGDGGTINEGTGSVMQ